MRHTIVIVDFGSQFTQLILRHLRKMKVFYLLVQHDELDCHALQKQYDVKGVILSGGPGLLSNAVAQENCQVLFQFNVPVLGICYGMQWISHTLGGSISAASTREFGLTYLTLIEESPLMTGVFAPGKQSSIVWMSHNDQISTLPPGFTIVASTEDCQYAAIQNIQKGYYGVQFHPEVTHTENGHILLNNFVLHICRCEQHWQITDHIHSIREEIQDRIGNEHVILAVSGGVDSTVVAALLQEPLKKQLHCILVDHGLMRKDEVANTKSLFKKYLNIDLEIAESKDIFFSRLHGVSDPEKKREIIGHTFVDVFDDCCHRHTNVKWLAQGTINSDVIESANHGKSSHKIKSHHNVAGLPEGMKLKLIEPIRILFKDEVRAIGRSLGLPECLINPHPFPGPGLAVRVLGAIEEAAVEMLRQSDAIFIEELCDANQYNKTSQAFAVFLPVKSVGVMGDSRTYENVVALRAVTTTDFMTAHATRLPYELLERVATRIVNEVPGISRVVYDISSKPPATIEWE